MAGNTTVIDEVVAPVAITQFTQLTVASKAATDQMVLALQAAIALNNATGGSQNIIIFKNNAQAAAIATQSLIQAQNLAATSAVKLQQAHNQLASQTARAEVATQKAAAAAQKALSPYQQLSKQLDTLRAHAKDVGVQFGEHSKQFKAAAKPVQELDERLKGIDKTLGQSQRNVGNYGDAFRGVLTQYIPFGEGTIRIGENLKALGLDMEGSAEKLGTLGAGFAEFTTVAFIAAIASAAYYLSQFKSTGNEVEKFLGGLKEQFANFGGNIIEGLKNISPKSFLNLIPGVAIYNAGKNFKEAFNKGVDDASVKIDLVNADELDENANRVLKTEAEKNRALASDRKIDIADRVAYIKKAQEAENQILDNQKENAALYIGNAIAIGDKRKKLSDEQISRLLSGDLKYAQELAENGQQFSEEGYELYKKGIEKKLAAQEGANNQIVQLQADADNMQLKSDRALAQAQERLDKARLASALDKSKLILNDERATFDVKTKANEDFISDSLRLAKVERDNALGAAGLGGRGGADNRTEHVTRLAIEQEYQNQLNKIKNEGLNNTQKIQKEENERLKKYLADMLTLSKESEQEQLEILDNASKLALRGLNKAKDDKENALSLERAKGKISEKKYNEELLAINDQFAIDRISQEIATQQAILAAKEGRRDASVLTAKINKASPQQIAKIQSEGDKDAQPTKDKIADLGIDLGNAIANKNIHSTKSKTKDGEEEKKQIEQKATDLTVEAIDAVDSLRQKAFENEIARLEKQGKMIDENAQIEKDAVSRSLDTQSNKARRIAILDAQTASAHKALQEKENQEKRKAAKADKEATIAKIIATGALAVVNAFTTQPAYLGIILGALVAASVGIELAKAVATPLPQFARGTGTGAHQGGLLVYGEKGSERVDLPTGETFYSPGVATIANLPKGTKITPHNMLPETPRWTANRTDNSDVVAAVNENTRAVKQSQPKQGPQRVSGWINEQRKADAWNSYSSNHFK